MRVWVSFKALENNQLKCGAYSILFSMGTDDIE